MKLRNGFVSNSSSSSFVVSLNDITAIQKSQIENHIEEAKMLFGWQNTDWDQWHINTKGNLLEGSTIMDNFDMREFLEKIGIDMSKVHFD
jgi:hypothetical protein